MMLWGLHLSSPFWTCVAGNAIKRVSGLHSSSFGNLVTLELRGNKLETTDNIDLPNLRHLYMVITQLASFSTKCIAKCNDQKEKLSLKFAFSPWQGPESHQKAGGTRQVGASHHPSPPRQPAGESGRPQPQHEVYPVPQRQVRNHKCTHPSHKKLRCSNFGMILAIE